MPRVFKIKQPKKRKGIALNHKQSTNKIYNLCKKTGAKTIFLDLNFLINLDVICFFSKFMHMH